MSTESAVVSGTVVWMGKPWIIPGLVFRTLVVFAVFVLIAWIEIFVGISANSFLMVSLLVWTAVVFFLIWLFSLVGLLVLRASNTYILRTDSLELKYGIFTLKSYMIVASGFSDLEVTESVTGRMLNYGNIVVRLQSETAQKMVLVREPIKVGAQIRTVLARPIVRLENPSKPS